MSLAATIINEGPIGFSGLAKRITSRRRDGHITAQCCWRWFKTGVRRPDGAVVRLEAVLCAGRYLTSFAAYERFVAAQNTEPTPLPTPPRSATKRQRDDSRAAELLAEVGI